MREQCINQHHQHCLGHTSWLIISSVETDSSSTNLWSDVSMILVWVVWPDILLHQCHSGAWSERSSEQGNLAHLQYLCRPATHSFLLCSSHTTLISASSSHQPSSVITLKACAQDLIMLEILVSSTTFAFSPSTYYAVGKGCHQLLLLFKKMSSNVFFLHSITLTVPQLYGMLE